MKTQERKAKEKENLKALILEGARRLFIEKGIEQTTIRNIADEIHYSIGTVYVYYKDKNEILHALHSQGFLQLGNEIRVLFNVSAPMERLKAMGRVYIKFAMENQDMYDLMFNLKAPMECLDDTEDEHWDEGKATFNLLMSTVNECIKHGHFSGHNPEALAFLIWSAVHGMCSLHIRERTQRVEFSDPDKIVENAYETFIKILDN
ncbi:MAG TPA: TetR/AcrR family transcriptional regulator [Saprospiraceae bacterium]|nr:TetR/AcrR family transcriptional regulator [Saprospiraceae bacterium]